MLALAELGKGFYEVVNFQVRPERLRTERQLAVMSHLPIERVLVAAIAEHREIAVVDALRDDLTDLHGVLERAKARDVPDPGNDGVRERSVRCDQQRVYVPHSADTSTHESNATIVSVLA